MGTFDISRINFDKTKHYSSVRMQQGRVLTDDDWNENERIEDEDFRESKVDIIGPYGTPDDGFLIKNPQFLEGDAIDFDINPGTIYLGGLRLELEAAKETFRTQKDWLQLNPNSYTAGDLREKTRNSLVYIEAWQQAVSAVEDSSLFEVALGGPDTTTRLKIMRRVHLAKSNADNCTEAWDKLKEEWKKQKLGKINEEYERISDTKLTVTFDKSGLSEDNCSPSAIGGYLGAENQAIRVQIVDENHFTWGFDNASPLYRVLLDASNKTITLLTEPKDQYHWPLTGYNVEILPWSAVLPNGEKISEESGFLTKVETSYDPDTTQFTIKDAISPDFGMGWKNRKDREDLEEQTPPEYFYMRIWNRGTDLSSDAAIEFEKDKPITLGQTGIEITISGNEAIRSDFWVIAARPETPNQIVPWEAEKGISSYGVRRFFAPLAIIQWSFSSNQEIKGEVISDCRIPFLPLTDLLSSEDLRLHHKYLHGFGVVCGLKVKCGNKREGIIVETGVALDCEGYMIRVKKPIPYNLVERAIKQKLLNNSGNGRVSVIISRGNNHQPQISIEPFVLESFWDRVLEGTLIKDFWDHCIKNLIELFTANFVIGNEVVPVTREQRRTTAFINLFAQVLNPQSGSFAFISSKSTKTEDLGDGSDEDDLLREFYYKLREQLESETYCGMYDGDRPFPDYIIEPGLDTIFGPPFKIHQKLKTSADGRFAYTCGGNNKVYVYSVGDSQELIQVSTVNGGTNFKLTDIVINSNGDVLYAVGNDNSNTLFAMASIDSESGKLRWKKNSIVSNEQFVSLGIDGKNNLYAIAKAKGLYLINGIGNSTFSPRGIKDFNATGLLHISNFNERWIALAGDNFTNTPISNFDGHLIIDLDSPGQYENTHLIINGNDATNDIISDEQYVYASGNRKDGQRIISRFYFGEFQENASVDVEDNGFIRMAIHTGNQIDYLLFSLSAGCKVLRVPLNREGNFIVDTNFRIPTQLASFDIVVHSKNNSAYVLNAFVNTLTTINLAEVFNSQPQPTYTMEPPVELWQYRRAVYNAYLDLLTHLVQSLKDCFCDKFLVDCPECDEDDKVYLGCVDIRNNQVHHICNFTKRKYVKSFKTVEYWMSTIPVMPIVREAFSKFCCMVIEPKPKETVVKAKYEGTMEPLDPKVITPQ
ncbi:hypothetical protein EI546_08985 [Aequorivita sp. H23M31]|uniref:Uncharacterized protein n=1 Tax=Aequorivita ciconiae TaxID=2494375 RepID=A0A410G3J2_9FLAO|nr:DUF6519 domain-containing protein [Aequorivita sp. H23M31]QAA81844.1 hypothetical protein EI546_08985 [Aequorivita sp. H23M31]